MKNLSKLFYRKASLALAIAFTLLSFSYLFLIMMDTAKCFQFGSGTESLSMSFGLTQELVQGFFSARSKEMVECFKAFNLIWDNVFPLLYGVMYTCWLSLIYKPFSHKAKLLNLLPFVQALFDWSENYMMVGFSNVTLNAELISNDDIIIASVFSMGKWTVSGLVFLLLLVGIVWRIVKKVRGEKSEMN